MLFSYSIILLSLFLVLFFITKNGFCVRSISAAFIFVTHFIGYPILHLRYMMDNSYPSINELKLNEGIILSFYGLLVFLIVATLFKVKVRTNAFNIDNRLKANIYCYVYWSLFISSILFYILTNGISFHTDGNYGNRLEDNAGNGILLINMAAFIPAVAIGIMNTNNRKEVITSLLFMLFSGLLFFVVIGGSRNVLAGALVVNIYICFRKGYIGKKTIAFSGLVLMMLMNVLVLFRYNVSFTDVNIKQVLVIFISYLVDSISPIYYQAITVDLLFNSSSNIVQGWDIFLNQFLALVPRFFWIDKPIVMMNSSYFFTQYILGMNGNLNMAATLLSSSILILGKMYIVIYAISAIFVSFIDHLLQRKSVPVIVLAAMAMPFCFFMARESLELYMFMVLKYAIMIFIGAFISNLIYFLVPKKC